MAYLTFVAYIVGYSTVVYVAPLTALLVIALVVYHLIGE